MKLIRGIAYAYMFGLSFVVVMAGMYLAAQALVWWLI